MAERIITVAERNLWVYTLPLPKDDAFAAIAEPDTGWDEDDNPVLWPLGVAIGLPHLDHDCVEVAWIDDLNGSLFDQVVGLTGSDPAVIEPKKETLNAAEGLVIFLSLDLDATEPSGTPDAPYQFLGKFKQESYSFSLGATSTQADPAKTGIDPPPRPLVGSSHSRNVVTALVVAAICLIPLMYWALQ